MPLYDFHCEGCEMDFEAVTPMGATAPACEHCGSPITRKLISMPHINQPGYLSRLKRQTKRSDNTSARVSEHLKEDCGGMTLAQRKEINSRITHSKGKKVKLEVT